MTGIMCLNDGYCSLSVADKHQVVALKPDVKKTGATKFEVNKNRVKEPRIRESVQQLMLSVRPLQIKAVDLLVDLSSETISYKAMPNISSNMQALWRKNQIRINHKMLYMCQNKMALLDLHDTAVTHVFATGYTDKHLLGPVLLSLLELGIAVKSVINLSQVLAISGDVSRSDWELLVTKKSANAYRLVCVKAGLVLLSRELSIVSEDDNHVYNELNTECQIIRQHLITKNILNNEDMQKFKIYALSNDNSTENKWTSLDKLDKSSDIKQLNKSKPLEYFNSWLELYGQNLGLPSKHTHAAHKCLFFINESRFILFNLLFMVILFTGILLYQEQQAESIYALNVSEFHILLEQTQLNLADLKQKIVTLDKDSEYMLPVIEFSESISKTQRHSPASVIKDLGQIISHYPGLYVDNLRWKVLEKIQDSDVINQPYAEESIIINGGLIKKNSSAIEAKNPLQPLLNGIARNRAYRLANYDWHYTTSNELNYSLEIYRKEN